MKYLLRTIIVFFVGVLFLSAAVASAQDDLTIGNYTLISKVRVSRTEYNYTYQADVINSGSDIQNVTATLTSNSSHTTVVDGSLDFGDVASASTGMSSDTFTIRQDRRYPLNWSDLVWETQYQIPEGTTGWVGSSGGTVTDPGGASVFIPSGALAEERLLSIKTHHNTASLPAPAPFMGGVNLGPDGLVLQLPITITLPLNTNLLPGTQLPLFLYDNQNSGWSYTGVFAYVNPDGVSASVDVTHFSDYIIMGMGEEDVNYYFGSFKARFFDICNPTPTIDLYNEFKNLWSTYYFPIGYKHIWESLSTHYPNRGYACYEVSGIQFVLTSSRAVPRSLSENRIMLT